LLKSDRTWIPGLDDYFGALLAVLGGPGLLSIFIFLHANT